MKTIIYIFLLAGLVTVVSAQDTSIWDVMAAQRTDGSQLVDIGYNLDGPLPSYYIYAQVSFNNGNTFHNIGNVSGDVGVGITPGEQKSIVWDFGLVYPYQYSDSTLIKIIGDSGNLTTIEFVNVPVLPPSNFEDINYDYQVMKYEVTNFQYAQYLQQALADGNITVAADTVKGDYYDALNVPFIKLNTQRCRIGYMNGLFFADPGWEDFPVVGVTYYGAVSFAERYGWSIPTWDEWKKAAVGETDWNYAYGYNLVMHYANYLDSDDPFEPGMTPVGYYAGSPHGEFWVGDAHSPYGTYDQTGNVFEFINFYTGLSHWYGYTGGSWKSENIGPEDNPLRVDANPEWVDLDFSYRDIGFRCVIR